MGRHHASRIAVYAAQQVVDTEVGHQYGEEGEDAVAVQCHGAGKPRHGAAVERGGIDEHRDECPHLLGVPAPVAAPRHVGPHGTDEDACHEQHQRGIEHQAAGHVELTDGTTMVATAAMLHLGRYATYQGAEKQHVGHHDDRHVDAQQGRAQHRYQRFVAMGVAQHHHRSHYDATHTAHHGGDAYGQRARAQQVTEAALALEEEAYHRHQQQQIACVGDGYAVGVVTDGEYAAAAIRVVARLIEPVALVLEYLVHGHRPHGSVALRVGDEQMAHIVLRCVGALVVLHLEVVECDAEGQYPLRAVAHVVGLGRRHPLTQMHTALYACEVRGERPYEDEQQRHVQPEGAHPSPHTLSHDVERARHGSQRPQRYHPPRGIDV